MTKRALLAAFPKTQTRIIYWNTQFILHADHPYLDLNHNHKAHHIHLILFSTQGQVKRTEGPPARNGGLEGVLYYASVGEAPNWRQKLALTSPDWISATL